MVLKAPREWDECGCIGGYDMALLYVHTHTREPQDYTTLMVKKSASKKDEDYISEEF